MRGFCLIIAHASCIASSAKGCPFALEWAILLILFWRVSRTIVAELAQLVLEMLDFGRKDCFNLICGVCKFCTYFVSMSLTGF